jgi:GH25 family lysozyme M1 (1,4-beta-N-acetylmuramidase)
MIKSHKGKINEVVCNCCGKQIKKYSVNNANQFNDYIHIEKTFTYLSNHDMEIHNIDICEDCYDKFIATFKIKPQITEYSIIS